MSTAPKPTVREVFPGLFIVPEPVLDDAQDRRICATCNEMIWSGAAGKRCTDDATVHAYDCRPGR